VNFHHNKTLWKDLFEAEETYCAIYKVGEQVANVVFVLDNVVPVAAAVAVFSTYADDEMDIEPKGGICSWAINEKIDIKFSDKLVEESEQVSTEITDILSS